jgi:hypothetical protein
VAELKRRASVAEARELPPLPAAVLEYRQLTLPHSPRSSLVATPPPPAPASPPSPPPKDDFDFLRFDVGGAPKAVNFFENRGRPMIARSNARSNITAAASFASAPSSVAVDSSRSASAPPLLDPTRGMSQGLDCPAAVAGFERVGPGRPGSAAASGGRMRSRTARPRTAHPMSTTAEESDPREGDDHSFGWSDGEDEAVLQQEVEEESSQEVEMAKQGHTLPQHESTVEASATGQQRPSAEAKDEEAAERLKYAARLQAGSPERPWSGQALEREDSAFGRDMQGSPRPASKSRSRSVSPHEEERARRPPRPASHLGWTSQVGAPPIPDLPMRIALV